jgi:hypothetical protein
MSRRRRRSRSDQVGPILRDCDVPRWRRLAIGRRCRLAHLRPVEEGCQRLLREPREVATFAVEVDRCLCLSRSLHFRLSSEARLACLPTCGSPGGILWVFSYQNREIYYSAVQQDGYVKTCE